MPPKEARHRTLFCIQFFRIISRNDKICNSFLLAGHSLHNFAISVDNLPIVLSPVGVEAAGTVLAAIRTDHKVSPAPGPQQIERTPAEQTVEILRVRPRMAGKVFTFPVGEIRAFFIRSQMSQSFEYENDNSIINMLEQCNTNIQFTYVSSLYESNY